VPSSNDSSVELRRASTASGIATATPMRIVSPVSRMCSMSAVVISLW
jgi:hypothetical protein